MADCDSQAHGNCDLVTPKQIIVVVWPCSLSKAIHFKSRGAQQRRFIVFGSIIFQVAEKFRKLFQVCASCVTPSDEGCLSGCVGIVVFGG